MQIRWTLTHRLIWTLYLLVASGSTEILFCSGRDSIVNTLSVVFVLGIWLGVFLSYHSRPTHIAYISCFSTIIANYNFWFAHVQRKTYMLLGLLPQTITLAEAQGHSIIAKKLANGSFEVYHINLDGPDFEKIIRKNIETHHQVLEWYSAYYRSSAFPGLQNCMQQILALPELFWKIPSGALSAMLILSVPLMLFISTAYKTLRNADRRARYMALMSESQTLSDAYAGNVEAIKLLKQEIERAAQDIEALSRAVEGVETFNRSDEVTSQETDLALQTELSRQETYGADVSARLSDIRDRMAEQNRRLLEIQAETASIRRLFQDLL